MKRLILLLIRGYKKSSIFHSQIAKTLFLTDRVCRFAPSCADYTYQAVEKYGSLHGLYLGLRRIIRCHPFASGGYDPLT